MCIRDRLYTLEQPVVGGLETTNVSSPFSLLPLRVTHNLLTLLTCLLLVDCILVLLFVEYSVKFIAYSYTNFFYYFIVSLKHVKCLFFSYINVFSLSETYSLKYP